MVLYTLSTQIYHDRNSNTNYQSEYKKVITISPSPKEVSAETNTALKSITKRIHFPVNSPFESFSDMSDRCKWVLLDPETQYDILSIEQLPILLSYMISNSITINNQLDAATLSHLQQTVDNNLLMFIST